MDADALLLLRVFGYLLNVALFMAALLKYRHHVLVLGGWIVWMLVVIFAVMVRYFGYLNEYLMLIDYVTLPLLYVNAFMAAWVLVREDGKRK